MSAAIFTPEIKKEADAICARYEDRRAPLLEILHLIMERHGHLTLEAEKAIADYLELPPIAVREVVSFYTLYYTKPRAKTRFNVCRTLSCSLMGGNDVIKHMEEKLGVKAGSQTEDGACSLETVECLGACELAPMMQINDDEYIGKLTKEKVEELIAKAKK